MQIRNESRNGKPQMLDVFQVRLKQKLEDVGYRGANIVINGELMVRGANSRNENRSLISSFNTRETTRATIIDKISKAKSEKTKAKLEIELIAKETEWADTANNIYIIAWDLIQESCYNNGLMELDYVDRYHSLEEFINNNNLHEFIELVDTRLVNNLEEAEDHFKEILGNGGEGTILKNLQGYWKDHTSPNQIKFKEFNEFEMRVTGWYHGKEGSLFEKGIGGLYIESEDGLIKSKVGSGLSQAQRGLELNDPNNSASGLHLIDDFDFDQYNDTIITIKANEVSTNKKDSNLSLGLPTIKMFRHDKDIADDVTYIKDLFIR